MASRVQSVDRKWSGLAAESSRTTNQRQKVASAGASSHTKANTGDKTTGSVKSQGKCQSSKALQSEAAERTDAPAVTSKAGLGHQGTPSMDPLQEAAQVQAWAYMTATLGRQLESSRQATEEAVRICEKELAKEEEDIADARQRLRAERLLRFYDEVSDSTLASASALMQYFLQYEHESAELVAEAIAVSSCDPHASVSIAELNQLSLRIEKIHSDLKGVATSMASLSASRADSDVIQTAQKLLCVMDKHIRNLGLAQSSVQARKEILRLHVYGESLRLSLH